MIMETQIIELEKKYWQGMENHDYETVKKLTRFPCIIAGKNGVHSVDEANFKKMFDSGDGDKIKVLNFSDVQTQLVAENTAVIYRHSKAKAWLQYHPGSLLAPPILFSGNYFSCLFHFRREALPGQDY